MSVSNAAFSVLFLSLAASTAFAGSNGPIKFVTLSSGGLAEIVRSATVGQNAEINIDVPLGQVDDILKSIVIRDDKGNVKSLSLAGPTPVDEIFKTLPFKLSDLTSLPALLNSIKGSRIQAGEQQGVVLGVTEIPGNAQTPLSWQLSFLRDDGAISMVPLPGTQITIVDPAIRDKLKSAVSVISKASIDGARTISIKLDGPEGRDVDISYVVPAPIWKMSYRLVTGQDGTVRLQAWAIFENASGEDWHHVGITLSSGRPVTLRQRLHQLFWKQRLEVTVDTTSIAVGEVIAAKPLPRRTMPAMAMAAPPPAPMMEKSSDASMAGPADPVLAEEGSVTSTFALSGTYDVKNGDTLSVPILDQGVKAEMVSLFRPEAGSEHPTAAAMIDNDSRVSLPPGIITVYDVKQGYVGDAQTIGLPTGQKQAVSFALDQKVSITSEPRSGSTITQIKVVDGMISTTSITREDTVYSIVGASDAPRTVLIEEMKRPGWTFKADDMIDGTPTKDRIKTVVKAGETKVVTSTLSIVNQESFALADAGSNELIQWQDSATDPAMRAKLADLVKAKTVQDAARQTLEDLDQQFARGEADQQRARSNLQSVGSGDTKTRFEKLLNGAEDKLEKIELARAEQRKIIETANAKVAAIVRSF
ncbi:DUF4139 domain-containing protein [Rhizobium tumorigenes]|uniref:DUF4139 domain-containing protein n=1 Tax=Rhizobium tumorigenes TaxID=2041385 RepID=A0AAF1KX23_9HYPH|nr:DUF4139 domain-containing protein [Rhizobium tumorigenes]WFR98844.1 DUF4139 domain-containing protein [Rhizobium tumorigenes]